MPRDLLQCPECGAINEFVHMIQSTSGWECVTISADGDIWDTVESDLTDAHTMNYECPDCRAEFNDLDDFERIRPEEILRQEEQPPKPKKKLIVLEAPNGNRR